MFTVQSNVDPLATTFFFDVNNVCEHSYCEETVHEYPQGVSRPNEYRINIVAGVSLTFIWLATVIVAIGIDSPER